MVFMCGKMWKCNFLKDSEETIIVRGTENQLANHCEIADFLLCVQNDIQLPIELKENDF